MGFFGKWNESQYDTRDEFEEDEYEVRDWRIVFRDSTRGDKYVTAASFEVSEADIWFQNRYGENESWFNREDILSIELCDEQTDVDTENGEMSNETSN